MRKLLLLLFLCSSTVLFAQTRITGTITDAEAGTPLPGANIMITGTSIGTTTDFDGNFVLETAADSGKIMVSYIGFMDKKVSFDGTEDLGTITLAADQNSLSEIVVVGRGVIDLEADRRTPIAVSTITRKEIQQRATGNVEFPQVLKNTPNVYVTGESGGFGDSQMFVRGFDQSNTAFLLNGQPINGMEDGNMYWSNWAGITDIANAVQVQRGLGSSKLAISSVGGTVNIVTKATERNEGGFARFMVGNGSYLKGTVSYDTGIGENGWGFSFLMDYWQAHSKYADGTKGQGQNYFFSVGKKVGDHNFNFLLTGAPQWHDQNFSKPYKTQYNTNNDGDRTTVRTPGYDITGVRGNSNYGFKNGEYKTSRRNYYHKPVMNLNWDWDIDEDSDLSAVVYGSFGRGGGTGTYGSGLSYIGEQYGGGNNPENGHVNWDGVVESNKAIPGGYSQGFDGTLMRASVNNHQWYGSVVNYEYNGFENLSINVGGDLRFYQGDHFRQLTDLLGAKGRIEEFAGDENHTVSKTFKPDPWSALFNYADKKDRVDYDYSENINYQGGFAQVEYATDIFSVFVQGAVSNQSYQREDTGNFAETKESKKVSKTGYNVKGGASWSFLPEHTIYANAGKYSRQPYLDNVFPSYSDNTQLAEDGVSNENIVGLEAGYSFETDDLQVNVNAYYTKWENRFLSASGAYDQDNDGVDDFTNVSYLFSDIAQLHKGLELDVKWRPMMGLMVRGYATVGDWKYDGSSPVRIRDNDNSEFIDSKVVKLKGTRIGEAPQASGGLGVDYDIIPGKFSMYGNWNYYTQLYGFVDVEDAALASLEGETYQSEKLDPYSTFDIGGRYNVQLGDQRFQITANVYNLFDTEYVSQKDNFGYYYGNGLTYNMAVKYKF